MNSPTSLITLALLALTFTGCSKHSPDATVAGPKVHDLGVVAVSDGVQSRHDLGGGQVCIITPAIQNDGSIVLSMRVEQSGELVKQMKAQTRSDVPFQITSGNISIGMNPRIKQ